MATALGQLFADYEKSELRRFQQALNECSQYMPQSLAMKLPGIIVVGDQSSGKSTVLQTLSRVNLPRGQNLVTRCPLQMELHACALEAQAKAILHYTTSAGVPKDKVLDSLEDVANAVLAAQNDIAGSNNGIIDGLIRLEIHNVGAPELTVIDLPGLTHVATDDQPEDIHGHISKLIEKYMAGDAKVILCILPASTPDLQNNEAIKLAKKFDPSGDRTLGVISKADLCEIPLVDYMAKSKKVKLAKGFIMVRNGGPNQTHMSFEQLEKQEADFFASVTGLDDVPCKLGLPQLSQALLKIQEETLRKYMPDFIRQVSDERSRTSALLQQMGGVFKSEAEAFESIEASLAQITSQFTAVEQSHKDRLEGPLAENAALHLNLHLLEAGQAFAKEFNDGVGGGEFLLSSTALKVIQDELKSTSGRHLPNLWQPGSLIRVFQKLVQFKLGGPTNNLIQTVRKHVATSLEVVADHLIVNKAVATIVKCEMTRILDVQTKDLQIFMGRVVRQNERFLFTFQDERCTELLNALESDVRKYSEMFEAKTKAEKSGNVVLANKMEMDVTPILKTLGISSMSVLDNLVKLNPKEGIDRAARDLQLTLVAIYCVTFGRLKDDVPMGCRLLLVTEVSEKLESQVLHRQLKHRAHDIFAATKDENLQKKRLEVEAKVQGLDKAYEVFVKLGLVSK